MPIVILNSPSGGVPKKACKIWSAQLQGQRSEPVDAPALSPILQQLLSSSSQYSIILELLDSKKPQAWLQASRLLKQQERLGGKVQVKAKNPKGLEPILAELLQIGSGSRQVSKPRLDAAKGLLQELHMSKQLTPSLRAAWQRYLSLCCSELLQQQALSSGVEHAAGC